MMTIADQIYALVQTLPQEQAAEVLAFAELIRTQYQHSAQQTENFGLGSNRSKVLKQLYNITQNAPDVDPVVLIQEGRDDLTERVRF
ncbi:MAG: DUF2281 domain-containing protein [Oculatellaceae cyanobacterium Prado106]|jgi:hypothetical protein|nr:DUF2281 domain-containing protein [Oculatellaceae cyanobacterium Prado106]